MSNISYRIKVDAKPCKSYPGLSGPILHGGDVKDFPEETIEKIDEYDLIPYEVIHKAKVNAFGEREIIDESDEDTIDKSDNTTYSNNEDYICGTITSTGRECQREVDEPDETCWQH